MKSKFVLVFANGQPAESKIVKPFLADSPSIVAADGGANHLTKLGLVPDYIVGDLDSVMPEILRQFKSTEIIRREDQDHTDLEKTLDFCLESSADKIVVFGATGGRLDHEIANFGILQNYSRRANLFFLDNQFTIRVVREAYSFKTFPGQLLSLIALQSAHGVTLKGVQFPLTNADLSFGGRGVSNLAKESRVSISIQSGEVFLFLKHANAD